MKGKLGCKLVAIWLTSCELLAAIQTLRVGSSRRADYASLSEAIEVAHTLPVEDYVVLDLEDGSYFGHFVLNRPRITLRGRGAFTVLTGNLGQAMPGTNGQPLTWRGAATLLLTAGATDCVIENLTVENVYGKGMQAQAVSSEGDRIVFRLCRLLGWQDTVRLDQGRTFFDRCYISGHVDFIYGDGTAFFRDCDIFSRESGYIVAPATPAGRPGFVFFRCRVSSPYGDPPTYLGRPWKGSPEAVWIECDLGACVRAEGWREWRVPPSEVRFAEYGSTGPGGNSQGRVNWARVLTADQAATFNMTVVFKDWIP